jgi:hypothetical protein
MRKLFAGLFLLFVSFNLFAQGKEVGRLYCEIRALETPWTGTCFNNAGIDTSNDPRVGRQFLRTGQIIFRADVDQSIRSDLAGALRLIESRNYKEANYNLISRTDASYSLYTSYRSTDGGRMAFLNSYINMDSFPSEGKHRIFDGFAQAIALYTGTRLVRVWDWNHQEINWTQGFKVNGYYFAQIEFILYK